MTPSKLRSLESCKIKFDGFLVNRVRKKTLVWFPMAGRLFSWTFSGAAFGQLKVALVVFLSENVSLINDNVKSEIISTLKNTR